MKDYSNTITLYAVWVKYAEIIKKVPMINPVDKEFMVGDKFVPLEAVTATEGNGNEILLTDSNNVNKNKP